MLELLLAPQNIPFSVALGLMIGIGLLEGISTVIGFGFSQVLEGALPDVDVDVPEVDVDGGAGMETPSLMSRFLGWIRFKQVPLLMVLVVFLTVFSLSGFAVQSIVRSILPFYLPWYVAIVPALMLSIPSVRGISGVLARCIVKDETTAVSKTTFLGKIATITIGTARKGMPAEAKLTDKYGQVHYVMVEPDTEGVEFPRSTNVLIVNMHGNTFGVIRNPNDKLTD
jgi:hypothetical protein